MSAYKCLDCEQYFGRWLFFFTSDREGRCLPCYNRIKRKVDQHDASIQQHSNTIHEHHGKLETLEGQAQATNVIVQKHHDDIEVIQRDLPQLQHQVQERNETIEMMQQQIEVLQQQYKQLYKAEEVKIETLKLKQQESKERQEQEKTKQKASKERIARLKNETANKQGENLTKLFEFADKIEELPEEITIRLLNYGQSLVDEDGPLMIGDENLPDSSSPGRSVPDTNYGSINCVDDYAGVPDAYTSNWTRIHGKPQTAMF